MHFNYEAEDEPVHDEKDKFKVNFYFAGLDTAINSIDERFTQLKNVNYVFGCICNINEMQNKTSKAVLEECIKLEKALSHADSKDVDASELCGKSQAIAKKNTEQHYAPRSFKLHL